MAICLPLLKDGTLDEVMEHKAENDPKKSAKDLKAYYDKGYKTDITNIDIKGNEITFTKDGKNTLVNMNTMVRKH